MHRHDPALQMWMRFAVGSGKSGQEALSLVGVVETGGTEEALSQFFFLVLLVLGGSSFLSFCSFFSVSSFLAALPFLVLRCRVRSGSFSFFFFASFSFFDCPFLV